MAGSSPARRTESATSKHLLLRPRQREPAPIRIEARHARLFRLARKPAALPHLAVGQRWQRFVHHGIAVADARGGAFGVNLEGAAIVELAIGGASWFCFHRGEVAAEDLLFVVVEILAGDVFGWGLEAGGAGLGICRGADYPKGEREEERAAHIDVLTVR